MNFGSDNMSPVAPEIMAALTQANTGLSVPYGNDDVTARLDERFSELFEHPVTVFPVSTGSAANSIALAAASPPWGAVYCHAESHVNVDECGGPEFFTAGAKLIGIDSDDGKILPAALETKLKEAWIGVVHSVQPAAVSITQASECGTVYTPDEVAALSAIARGYDMAFHMDGARFGNAVASLGCTPAEVTWKAGVDMLSFGATKNGAMAAEAVVVFRPDLAETIGYRRKRSGHLLSKMRYCSAQLEAYVTDGLWLRLAAHSNAMAARLSKGLAALPGATLAYPVDGNETFVTLPEAVLQGLMEDGAIFARWGDRTRSTTIRLVTSFVTTEDDVDRFLEAVSRRLEGQRKSA